MASFDFGYWMNLSQSNPSEFERLKKSALMELVEQASPDRQGPLSQLVAALCAPQSGSPMERAISAQKMMLSSVLDLQSKNIELLNAQAGHGQIEEDAALKFSRLVLSTQVQ